jgi:hypothetical protein
VGRIVAELYAILVVLVDLEELGLGRNNDEILVGQRDVSLVHGAGRQSPINQLTSSACIAETIFSIVSGEIRTATLPLSSESKGWNGIGLVVSKVLSIELCGRLTVSL